MNDVNMAHLTKTLNYEHFTWILYKHNPVC